MTAGIFVRHGVWVGTVRPPSHHNAKGFFESNTIKDVMKREFPDVPASGLAWQVAGVRAEIESIIVNDGYRGGRWMYKCTALYSPAFYEFEYDAVCVLRNPEAIFQSTRASRMFGRDLSDAELRDNIIMHQMHMQSLVDDGAVCVYTDDVIGGDFSSIEAAIKHCGLDYDENAVADFVDDSLWHFK